ncbi:aldo/keto reductase [Microbacterium amylolyticum]|uniref:Aryl-alcohol dehydrogenase-like predicted oxidoreductase n=1 Tax=Microbacterium amylolyticum TaxID=936337 RepID=A0ABS4ZFW1_9MICO|nr:aldo/keto reductase [Microbacterium amylolyticum]MBP2436165.1 aryl-alcohol dehydrogenase-like predicted oxidoreductase [Microbacterium amylolyticum]
MMDIDASIPRTSDSGDHANSDRLPPHPSAPLPEIGPVVGPGARTRLGGSNIEVFPFVLGSREFGTTIGPRATSSVLDRYVELGGNAVHTSAAFGAGIAEEHVGTWMRVRGVRDDMMVISRVGGHPDDRGIGVGLTTAVEASLRRLNTDRIDVLVLDASAESDVYGRLEGALGAAEALQDRGLVRAIGAHGLDATQLMQARMLSSSGYPRIDLIDDPYSLTDREDYESFTRYVTIPQGVATTPTNAVPRRFLVGQAPRRWRGSFLRRDKVTRVLERVSSATGLSLAATAFAWVAAQEGVTAPVVDAFAPRHVEEIVHGIGGRLNRAHIATMSAT